MAKCLEYWRDNISEQTDPSRRKRPVCCEPLYAPCLTFSRLQRMAHPKRNIPYAEDAVTEELEEVRIAQKLDCGSCASVIFPTNDAFRYSGDTTPSRRVRLRITIHSMHQSGCLHFAVSGVVDEFVDVKALSSARKDAITATVKLEIRLRLWMSTILMTNVMLPQCS